jgi:2-iminobutanoate/2-iminopropanoate deaminase
MIKTTMTIERINYPGLAQPVGPYVHAVKSNGLLFLSGLTALGSPAQGQGLTEEAEAIFRQIQSIAFAEFTTLQSLVKVTIFITSFDGIDGLRTTLFNAYGEHLPASSLVQVARLFSPDIHVDIEAILAVAQSIDSTETLAGIERGPKVTPMSPQKAP